ASFGKPRPLISVSPKRRLQFRFQEFFDEAANAGPHPGFQGIEPIVPKEKRSFGCLRRRFYGIRFHDVISIGAQTPIRFELTNWRLRHLQIPTNPATAPYRLGGSYKLALEPDGSPLFISIPLVACWRYEPREHHKPLALTRPAIPPSPERDRVGYSDHDRFRGYFPVH